MEGYGLQKGDLLRLLPVCTVNDLKAPFAVSAQGVFDWGLSLSHFLPQTFHVCWCHPMEPEVPGAAGDNFFRNGFVQSFPSWFYIKHAKNLFKVLLCENYLETTKDQLKPTTKIHQNPIQTPLGHVLQIVAVGISSRTPGF